MYSGQKESKSIFLKVGFLVFWHRAEKMPDNLG